MDILLYMLTIVSTAESPERSSLKEQNIFVTPNSNSRTEKPKFSRHTLSSLIAKQDTKESKPEGNNHLHSSRSEVKRATKPLLVQRLLEERLEDNIRNQLSYTTLSPSLRQHPTPYSPPEEMAEYYQQREEVDQGEETDTSEQEDNESMNPTHYEYVYKVKDPEGNDFGHAESRDGDRTWGRYFVQLPDGRVKTVKYWADNTGFHAEVEYRGQTSHTSGSRKYKRL
ncbi:hypothetical protein L9F63_019184 [Diploptera punctata]|uniref:Uncharacterized protein n=1 Tax=Diploptera punctata TaxID=6984 RepID=A0AAD8EEF7_DIPPU|nr:hypothetical protein L9F63_019184 [Diploptera punctata]